MIRQRYRFYVRAAILVVKMMVILAWLLGGSPASAMEAVRGGALPQPLFPSDNWWNLDISSWPVDANSASYISFIHNRSTRRLHPDFGGNDTSR